jgi:solute carrier family 35, member F5
MVGVEHFTLKKLVGVLASLAGIILISSVDMSGKTDENRGSFPHKTPREITIGDSMAVLSALLYGIYVILMKKRVGDESRVNMPLFFGFIGLFNVLALWPGLIILHYTEVEKFELPPTRRILTILLLNAASSTISDFCWAFSMLLTSPLIVTVGLSLTIPLSLIGQIIIDSQYVTFTYWVGAGIVLLSFIFINHEESKDENVPPQSYENRLD